MRSESGEKERLFMCDRAEFLRISASAVALVLSTPIAAVAEKPRASAGASPIATAPGFGEAFVTPGADHVVHWNRPFHFSFEYFAGPEGVPPGAYLEMIPFPVLNYGLPRVSLWTNKQAKKLRIIVDHFYTSMRRSEPGSPARFFVTFDDGLEEGEAIRLRYTIPNRDLIPFCYGVDGGGEAAFHLNLRNSDEEILASFDTPKWKTATDPARELRVHVPSQARVGEEVDALVVFGGLFGRPVERVESDVRLTLPQSATAPERVIRFGPEDRGAKRVPVTFSMPGVFTIRAESDLGFSAAGNPIRVGDESRPSVLWGDMHNHTTYSWDSRNLSIINIAPLDMVRVARDRMLLDYVAITDHGQHMWMTDYQQNWRVPVVDMTPDEWESYDEELASADHPGITAFVGYEHRDLRGDTCVIFRNRATYFIEDGRRLFIEDMWERHKPGEIVTIPHFHPLFGEDKFDRASPHEQLAELHSVHGMCEYYKNPEPKIPHRVKPWMKHDVRKRGPFYRELLEKGFRLGVSASSDHGITGQMGLTAVKAEKNTRDAIFDALLARRTYADTGARMLMDFNVSDLEMGQERRIKADDALVSRRDLFLEVHAPAPIERVQIIRNGAVFFERNPGRADWRTEIVDEDDLAGISPVRELTGEPSTYYYLRVELKNGHVGWASPVFLLLDPMETATS